MPKINRYNGNVQAFASAAPGTERTIFGDIAQSNELTAQITADFLRGWGIVGPSDQPTLQDFNAAMYTHGQMLAYLHQMGVPEYNAAQEYHLGSVTTLNGQLYISLQNSNTGNNPETTTTFWRRPVSNSSAAFNAPGVTAWIVPAGVSRVFVRVIAGGGGGGKRDAVAGIGAGGGGGGGGYTEAWVSVTPGASINVTVGAGGAGASVANTNGSNGGASSFGVLLSATGGSGGGATGGGSGGMGSGGSLNTSTGPGTTGIQFSNSQTVDAGSTGSGGGAGGVGVAFNNNSPSANGNPGMGPGGGGSGAIYGGSGGNGFPGYVSVEW